MIKRKDQAVLPVSALHLLHRAGQCADELFASNVGESPITPRQFAVMQAVAASDEPSQTTLVHMTGIDRSTLADIVRRLVQRDMLQRRRTRRDARMYAVRLTEAGEAALRRAEPALMETDEALLSGLPSHDRQTFLRTLSRIVSMLEPHMEGKAPDADAEAQRPNA